MPLRPTQRARCAFSLFELMVVLLLLSVLAAVTVPAVRGFAAGRRTEDAASQIVALALYARSQAATEGRPYRLNLNPQNRTYWLTVQVQGTYTKLATSQGQVFQLPDDTGFAWEAPNDIASRNYIQFDPNGSHEPGILRLTGRAGHGARVLSASPTEPLRMAAFGPGGGG